MVASPADVDQSAAADDQQQRHLARPVASGA
jgi:hypothetical protein